MARSIRVEVYLQPETIDSIDDKTENRSEWIRDAILQKLEGGENGD